jgi:hypothetical protein
MLAPLQARKFFFGFTSMSAHAGPYGVVMSVLSLKGLFLVNSSKLNVGLNDELDAEDAGSAL